MWGGGGRWRVFGGPGWGYEQPTPVNEEATLKSWSAALRKQLEAIEKRLGELKGE